MKVKKKKIYGLLFVAVLLTALSGCYYDVEDGLYPAQVSTCDTVNVSFSAKVVPILEANCYSCHTGSAPSGDINLLGHANVKTVAENGRLLGAITHSAGFQPMPQGGNKLSDCQIATIKSWITSGTANN